MSVTTIATFMRIVINSTPLYYTIMAITPNPPLDGKSNYRKESKTQQDE
jgi:hypothetical protein